MTPLAKLVFAALLVLALAAPAAAQGLGDGPASEEYANCMAMTRSQPELALESASAWEAVGGAEAAQHCAAVALLGLGRYADAATRLENLAVHIGDQHTGLQGDLLAQAGQAWLLADDTNRAYSAQSAAIKLHPNDVELYIDRAITLATAKRYWEAIDDLNEAETLAPNRGDVLIFRASAYRFVEANDMALHDVERGLQLDPDNPEGLLERGILRRLAGDDTGARQDWLRVVTVAADTPAAEAAQANLAALDVKAE
jgi:tetratricopeptide (TPR) repeat protein